MTSIPEPGKHEKPSTYVVQDRNNDEELHRLTIQDQAGTKIMGGVLAEQPDPTIFHSILDVGCATGGWAIEVARQYPTMKVVGVDISERMLRYAQQRAEEAGVADRVSFRIMDALRGLDFRDNTFDLVNERANFSYIRKWDWRKYLYELQRVVRPSGVVRLTEVAMFQTTEPALGQLCEIMITALYQAAHFFEPTAASVINHLEELVTQTQYEHVQRKETIFVFGTAIETPESQAFLEDVRYLFRTTRPFLEKYGSFKGNYTALYQQAMEEMQAPDFRMQGKVLTVWATKPDNSLRSETRRLYGLPPPPKPTKEERSSTYFVLKQNNDEELHRLLAQERLLTTTMGGVLSEQSEIERLQLVLDVGCGPGGWAIETAQEYPWLSVAGVDISARMVRYAQQRAEEMQMSGRTRFYVMDAISRLDLRDEIFDLVNVRFSVSYVRKLDWPKFLYELSRVTRPGGIIRVTEPEFAAESSSPALEQLNEKLCAAMYELGYLFSRERSGITDHLETVLKKAGYERIQTRAFALQTRAGTPECQGYYEDIRYGFRVLRPLLEKTGQLGENYDALYQQAMEEMRREDFTVRWNLLTAWGYKHSDSVLYDQH